MHGLATQNNMQWCQERKKDLSNGLEAGFKGDWRQWPADNRGETEQHKPIRGTAQTLRQFLTKALGL